MGEVLFWEEGPRRKASVMHCENLHGNISEQCPFRAGVQKQLEHVLGRHHWCTEVPLRYRAVCHRSWAQSS